MKKDYIKLINLFVSIVIPVKEVNNYILESMKFVKELEYQNYEILILPDEVSETSVSGAKVIPTGKVGPAEKRNFAVKFSKGEILAFLDDDAYPRRDWLINAVKHFANSDVAAVGGPAVTPDDDNLWQKASGEVFSSWLASGKYIYRYKPGKFQEVDDYPSVNLFIRKKTFEEIGGFDYDYYPGEDTKLCLDIIKLGKKIIYDPSVFVYHHRRKLFKEHFHQVSNYAVHRGYFVKKYPQNSFKLEYFVPSMFLIFIIISVPISFIYFKSAFLFATVMTFYLLLIVLNIYKLKGIKLRVLTALGIFTTHIIYGAYFIKGLFSKNLVR